jgi:agmatine deiminase
MPAETAPHERTWMAFPRAGLTLGEDPASAAEAYAAWTAVAHAVAEFEPVTMVVDPSERVRARDMLGRGIEIVEAPLDEFWMRDVGPTFVVDDERPGGARRGGLDLQRLGRAGLVRMGKSAGMGRFIAARSGAELVSSMLVNEGGALHVDGRGTVLVTETVQLDPGRNPYTDKARVEAELERTLGTTKTIWVPRGLTRDYEDLGTRGHIDMVATLPSPGRILLHAQTNPDHPDFDVSRSLAAFFDTQTDADGKPFEVIQLPAPQPCATRRASSTGAT